LKELEVAPLGSMSGYSREKFPHRRDAEKFRWDSPAPSCDARDAALVRNGE
jgi:hypothetical protein